jgi:hypothetical protein
LGGMTAQIASDRITWLNHAISQIIEGAVTDLGFISCVCSFRREEWPAQLADHG